MARMRICPKCRLITADSSVCAECGWDLHGISPGDDSVANQVGRLRGLVIFIAVMFAAGFVMAFSVTHGSRIAPPLAGGLFAAGLIADLFLLRLIYLGAGLYRETRRWTVGAVLTFPFGTLVFGWLLARRLDLSRKTLARNDIL